MSVSTRLARALVGIASMTLAACAKGGEEPASRPAHVLLVWAGPHMAMGDSAKAKAKAMKPASDFLAVIDADSASPGYGRVIASVPVGNQGAMAHHMDYVLSSARQLFANDYGTGQVFVIDVADPLAPKVVARIDSVPGFAHPHSFKRLASGNVLATLQYGNGTLPGNPGGIGEFTPRGQLVRTASSADSAFRGARIRDYGLETLPTIDRAISTSAPMDTEHTANLIQVWKLADLRLLKTLEVPGVAGDSVHYYPFEIRTLGDGKSAFMNSYNCALYHLTGLDGDAPKVTLVRSLAPARKVGCAVPTVIGHWFVLPIAYTHEIVSFDVSDPTHPVETSVLRSDSTFLPHWVSPDPSSDRIVVTGQDDGEARVMMMHFDPRTGTLSWDERFRDAGSARRGVSFARASWPHGTVGSAMPHGAVFSATTR